MSACSYSNQRYRLLLVALLPLVGLGVMLGCGKPNPPSLAVVVVEPTPAGPAWFDDVTDQLGIDFTHDPGPLGAYPMQQIVGSGCAACDLDGDGRVDLLFLTNGGPQSSSTNKLYRQKFDGTFEDVTVGSGLDFAGYNMGVAIGDFNNDGKPDVLITQYTGVRLFLNRGGLKFTDVTAEMGIKNPLWATSASFVDYNRDGWLDLVVVNYVEYDPFYECAAPGGGRDYCNPKVFAPTCSKLFKNLGPDKTGRVRFEDVSFASNLGKLSGPGLGVTVADFDGDGWPDIFIANDGKPNHLWINQRDGTFAEEGISRGVAYTMTGQAYANMGIALGDVDNDGLFDLFVTHLGSETNTFWKQGPRGQFRDQTTPWGVAATDWRGTGFGTLMADFDLDGFVDLAIVNGRVSKGVSAASKATAQLLPPFWQPFGDRNQILANQGGRKFQDVSRQNPAFCGSANVGRGLACADVDGDGAPDLIVTSIGGRARVYRNVCPERGYWLSVRAFDPKLNRDAYGAVVTVHAGDQRWSRLINPSVSFLSSGSPLAHFGLGTATTLDRIEVLWPDGTREIFAGGKSDRALELRQGDGRKP